MATPPLDIEEMASEGETAYLLKSEAVKRLLVEARARCEGISLEEVRAKLGVHPATILHPPDP